MLRGLLEGAVDFFRRNRQVADAHADGVRHGVGDGWRDRRERALTDALDLVGTDTVCRLYQHRVVSGGASGMVGNLYSPKEGFVTSAVLDLQLLGQGVANALHDGTINLALVPDRIDDLADIMGRGEAQHLDLARLRVNSDLGDLHREGSDVERPRSSMCARPVTDVPVRASRSVQRIPASWSVRRISSPAKVSPSSGQSSSRAARRSSSRLVSCAAS